MLNLGLPEFVKYAYNFAIAISGVIALFVLIRSGFIYLTSAGDVTKMKDAKDRLLAATLGLIILFSSYILLTTINPQLVVFNFPPLPAITPLNINPLPIVETADSTAIANSLPLASSMLYGVWDETKTKEVETLITNFEIFLKQEVKINDPELENDTFNKISDLNKYLTTVAAACQCGGLRAFCTKPATGSAPIGCSGDPCQYDQDAEVEPDSPRAKINKITEIDQQKIKELLDYQKKIKEKREILKNDLAKFGDIEGEIVNCENQNGELTTLSQYLSEKQSSDELGIKSTAISLYNINSRANGLTFFCSAGGTINDHDDSSENFSSGIADPSDMSQELSCPIELETGEILDSLRESAVTGVVLLDRLSNLSENMAKKIQEMQELISQCNGKECQASCACIPNPCYRCCAPPACSFCIPFCLSQCLQGVGGCSGTACPMEKLNEKAKEIKEIDDKLLETIDKIKTIFAGQSPLLAKLNSLSTSTSLCVSSDIENPTWEILTCNSANGNFDKNGNIITACHPRNLYCCNISGSTKPLPVPTDTTPFYIIPAREYQPLSTVDNCPKGWLCSKDIKDYGQYNDASKPLKQLLACMRPRLDAIQNQDESKAIIGEIATISDAKLYQKTCDWEAGPAKSGGCSYAYSTKYGKERVSAHYGGANCRYDERSYAVNFDLSADYQKKYVKEIIKIAKECFPGAYILDESPYLHIDIAQIYECGSTE